MVASCSWLSAPPPLKSEQEKSFSASLRDYTYVPELHLAVRLDPVWEQMVHERAWWHRIVTCNRVGHCQTTPVTFLPMPGDVRVCVRVPKHRLDVTAGILVEMGDWMESEISFVRKCLTERSSTIDIGANHGVFALTMAKIASAGQVYAFEPADATADLLETSKHANQLENLHIFREAVSDTPGSAQFIIREEGSEYNHLSLDGTNQDEQSKQTVKVTTLDECMVRMNWSCMDFVKIDAEGAEHNIIRGGQQFFNRFSPLIMFEADHAGVGQHDILTQSFLEMRYCLYSFVPGLCGLVPLDERFQNEGLNLFACKDDRADELASRGLLLRALPVASAPIPPRGAGCRSSRFWDMPYVRAMSHRWDESHLADEGNGGRGQCAKGSARGELEAAMSEFHMSKDTSLSLGDRYASLASSYLRLLSMYEAGACNLRAASLLRVERALLSMQREKVAGVDVTAMSAAKELLRDLCREGSLRSVSHDVGGPEFSPQLLDDRLSEPFLSASDSSDWEDPPAAGYGGCTGMHTWAVRR